MIALSVGGDYTLTWCNESDSDVEVSGDSSGYADTKIADPTPAADEISWWLGC